MLLTMPIHTVQTLLQEIQGEGKELLGFHLELAQLLLQKSVRVRRRSHLDVRRSTGGVCYLVRLSDIVG